MMIELSYSEIIMATTIASMMGQRARQDNAKPIHGQTPPNETRGWIESHVMGCLSELAVAKALNLYWNGNIGNYAAPDVGGMVDVRASRAPNCELILHPAKLKDGSAGDDPRRPFVLAHNLDGLGKFDLVGWIICRDGQKQEYWKEKDNNGRPAFWVPRSALRPMSELVELASTGILALTVSTERAA